MSTSETTAEHGEGLPVIHLSQLLRAPVFGPLRRGSGPGRGRDRAAARRRRVSVGDRDRGRGRRATSVHRQQIHS